MEARFRSLGRSSALGQRYQGARAAISTPCVPSRCSRVACSAMASSQSAMPVPALTRLFGRQQHKQHQRTCVVSRIAPPEALASIDFSDKESLRIDISNDTDPDCTVITVEGPDMGGNLLISVSGAFASLGIDVVKASINTIEGMVMDEFKVQRDGKKVPESMFTDVAQQLSSITTARSNRPAIYGMVAAAEVERLRPLSGVGSQDEVATLELAAAEMAQASAELVSTELEILRIRAKGKADSKTIAAKEALRNEAAAMLERKISAMKALMATRRTFVPIETPMMEPPMPEPMPIPVAAPIEQPKAAAAAVAAVPAAAPSTTLSKWPPPLRIPGAAGSGSGYEILFQGFNWESHKHNWYKTLTSQIPDIANAGFTSIWLPPPADSVSPQGYLPCDLYKMDSAYGTAEELKTLNKTMHDYGIISIADVVINHRCASKQSADGKWNKFGGKLAWDASAICCNNPAWGGRGNPKQGAEYAAAPNIDHTQDYIRKDYTEWLMWLKDEMGFDGWRLDFVRGITGAIWKKYIESTGPAMAFGEFWDSCEYTDGVINYNQDAHRQRIVSWCDSTGGTCGAFDFTTKGILQEAVQRKEFWRLVDSQGRPSGFMGMWPSKAITFIDNHDTGSTLNHWPFPTQQIPLGYAYILTHPGTPTVFYDHFYQEANGLRKAIIELTSLRKRQGIHARSKVQVRKATGDVYAATIDDRIAVKLGPGDWSPNAAGIKIDGKGWVKACFGTGFCVWEVEA